MALGRKKKLDAFSKYVTAYLNILQAHPYWQTIYFDGFAGSGSRKDPNTALFNQLKITLEEDEGYKGAAERVICLEKNFDYYYFVDNQDSIEKLRARLMSLPEAEGKKLIFKQEDCNLELKKLATAMRSNDYAALVLLDPFGMQINWDAIAGLKDTRSDIWLLLPTGVIVNRLLDKAGELKSIGLLESFFGLPEQVIRNEFYKKEQQLTLFGENEIMKKISNPIHHIANLYIRQLKTIWPYVTDKPLILRNSRNTPIYHFIFASNKSVAGKIAKDIIQKM